MATIGMLYICTGKYTVFQPELFTRLQKRILYLYRCTVHRSRG